MSIRFVTTHSETKLKVLDFVEEWNDPSDTICVKTSGSTGKPKEIHMFKEHMSASAAATGEFLDLKGGDTALLNLSMDTIGGRMMVVRSILLNLNLIVSDVTSTPLDLIKEKIDFAAMVPMQVQKTLDRNSSDLSKIDKLIIGGGPVSPQLIERIQDISTSVYHTFGMTETISHIAMRRLNHPLEDEFKCLPNVSIEEELGTLVINAPQIGVNALKSNDAIELISDTSFRWLGRTDFVINSGGIKLHPEQIEAQLSQLIHRPFYVYGESDDLLGERLILIIESEKTLNFSKKDFDTILQKYSVPKEIRYVEQFVYTKSGKINRVESIKCMDVAQQVL